MKKIQALLNRSGVQLSEARAARFTESVSQSIEKLIMDKKASVRHLQDQYDNKLEFISSVDTTVDAAVRLSNFNADQFVTELHEIKTQIALAEIEVAQAKKLSDELLSDVQEEG